MEFTNEEENKIIYMEIFNEYTTKIEDFIMSNLNKRAANFDMNAFLHELRYEMLIKNKLS